jgi:hypothetical protein
VMKAGGFVLLTGRQVSFEIVYAGSGKRACIGPPYMYLMLVETHAADYRAYGCFCPGLMYFQ